MTENPIDLSKSSVLRRPQIRRIVKFKESAERLTKRYETGAAERMVRAELKRQARYARNRRLAAA